MSNGIRNAKYSPFGLFVRKLRLERGLLLQDMAKSVDISTSWLSNIETGRKPVPKGLAEKVCTYFGLKNTQAEELKVAANNSNEVVSLRQIPNDRRDVAAALARNFNSMGEEDMQALRELLKKG